MVRPSDFPFQNLPVSISYFSKFRFTAKIASFSEVLAVFLPYFYRITLTGEIAFYTTLFRIVDTEIMLPCCIFTIFKNLFLQFYNLWSYSWQYRPDFLYGCANWEFRFKTQIRLRFPVKTEDHWF